MLKNKITFKLAGYFALALLVFSLIVGGVFVVLFRRHTVQLHKNDLEQRAVAIADTLSGFQGGGKRGRMQGGQHGGFGAYMNFLDDIAMTDVWVIDEDLELLTTAHSMHDDMTYAGLPPNAEAVVAQVFEGNTAFSEDFSDVLSVPTLTVGTPIRVGGAVVGVVLLHSPVNGTNEAVAQGLATLGISMAAALLVVALLCMALSLTFTKPLNKMKNTALLLIQGDYTAKNKIRQHDEIGQLADTMDVLADRLSEANLQSQKLDQLRRDFVANISHELRTPVTVMRGSLEALVDGVVCDPAQVREYHRQMLEEALFLQRLVGDLLDLSRLQNTDFVIEMSEINLSGVTDDAVRSMSRIAAQKDVTLAVRREGTPAVMQGDYGRLRQLVLILLDNAVKFSPEHGEVEVVLTESCLSVRDFGGGIAPDDLPYIFDRFYKSRSEQNKTGTGLGLAIAKQIAGRHQLLLLAENATDGGARFTLRCF